MEVSVIGSSQVKIVKTELAYRELGFCAPNGSFSSNRISFGKSTRWNNSGIRLTVKAVQSQVLQSQKAKRPEPSGGMRFYVGLPTDTVSDCNTVNHAKAIAAGIKALKLLGVEGVELPVWWGLVEKDIRGKYDWSGYLALAEMVEKVGLKLHVTLCFHASKADNIPLPKWVSEIGKSQPNIFFIDRSGQQYKECVSFAIDDSPIFYGKTPIQVYGDFCESFKSAFMPFFGTAIRGISMGLGPDGELRYPSHQQPLSNNTAPGVGEFQCYDTNMLSNLKQHAEANGNPLWGLSGPHDAPAHNQSPYSSSFFKDGGSWESGYGDFFLSWYSDQLIRHGASLLSLASSLFSGDAVSVYGKLPVAHSGYRTQSHPSELTAGFYNTVKRDGYDAVSEMFSRNSCRMILPGMDMRDVDQPRDSLSSPEALLTQIRASCRKHGVKVSGENLSLSVTPEGLDQIKKNMMEDDEMDIFIYQRMGAYFFSPEHFPLFSEFVRNFNRPELHADDLPIQEEAASDSVRSSAESSRNMQVA